MLTGLSIAAASSGVQFDHAARAAIGPSEPPVERDLGCDSDVCHARVEDRTRGTVARSHLRSGARSDRAPEAGPGSACAGLLAHLVTSKYVDSLATIAKTNTIRPRHLGRRWNGNHQRGDCRERRGSSVTRPVRLHAPHSGQTPEFASVSQRVSRPLVRAVVLVLRGGSRLATFAAADIESRSPHVIRRRHYRIPRIVREVAEPFP
jgi:hypothetical protein